MRGKVRNVATESRKKVTVTRNKVFEKGSYFCGSLIDMSDFGQ